ncbi:MAG: XRE family transcriptional regulator [Pseudohongiellaceae bacterium]
MIQNDREYRATKSALEKLSVNIDSPNEGKLPEWVAEASGAAIASQIQELQSEIEKYEQLKNSQSFDWECSDLDELPIYLVKARIARGYSQKDLAERLGMKQQQVQRYEASAYKGASLSKLLEISKALEITITSVVTGSRNNPIESDSAPIDTSAALTQFPIREMKNRSWISESEDFLLSIPAFLTQNLGTDFYPVFHRKKFYGTNKPHSFSLLAWQAGVLRKFSKEHEPESIPTFVLDDSWVSSLVELSQQEESPLRVKEFLFEKGICLIVEKHLDRTYLDGAALLSNSGNPIIALTLRHDRLDNFWFVLMHELGHIYKHLYQGLVLDFFDDGETSSADPIEQEADDFATHYLLPDEKWDLCASKFTRSEESVLADSQRLSINPAIVAGRIRKESGDYTQLTDLVGYGSVRKLFAEGCYD